MKHIFIIARKEYSFYLNNPVGYIVAGVFLVLSSFLFFNNFFLINALSMRPFFDLAPWLLIFVIAGVAMRTFAEEKRLNTMELLLTLPLHEEEIVLGKLTGALLYIGTVISLTLTIPLSFYIFGNPLWSEIIVGYVGLILYSALLCSLGMIFSLLTKNQIVALLVSLCAYAGLSLLGSGMISRFLPSYLGETLVYFSPLYHMDILVRGVISARTVLYFASAIVTNTVICIIFLKKRT